jgi:hypothetical protein
MIVICPAGPPNPMHPSFNQNLTASRKVGLESGGATIKRSRQYDFAQTTRWRLGSPLNGQVPGSGDSSKGMQRMVTLRSVLIFSSTAVLPFQCVRAKPPWISGFAEFLGVKNL